MTTIDERKAVTDVDDVIGARRAVRADAVRNRARILEAAEEVFASEGISVPIDVVAERAGVGVGTLYRHFPTKEALFEAIVTNRLLHLVDLAHEYATSEDALACLFEFLHRLAEEAAAKQDLAEALKSAGVDIKSRCAEVFEEMMDSVRALLERAVATGSVRDDLTADELVLLVVGACQLSGHGGPEARMGLVVDVICDGLRPTRQ